MHSERISILAVESELTRLRTAWRSLAGVWSVEEILLHKVELVLEELFLNSVTHGGAPADKFVDLDLALNATTLHLTYLDDGAPYNPLDYQDHGVLSETGESRRVGGLGVILVQSIAASAAYARENDRNCLRFTFARPLPAP